jgi:mannose-6-phosphate isomerase-like protein (cupin superfamily)
MWALFEIEGDVMKGFAVLVPAGARHNTEHFDGEASE